LLTMSNELSAATFIAPFHDVDRPIVPNFSVESATGWPLVAGVGIVSPRRRMEI